MADYSKAVERLERAWIAGMDEEFRDDLRTVLDALATSERDAARLNALESWVTHRGGLVIHTGEHGGGPYCGIAFATDFCPRTLRGALDLCIIPDSPIPTPQEPGR